MLWSKTTSGFYLEAVHGERVPEDAVDIPAELYRDLLAAQALGYAIVAGPDGLPVAIEVAGEPQVPVSCTPAQGLVALFVLKGITEDDVKECIARISDPVERYTAQIAYTRATSWEISSPTVRMLVQSFGLTLEERDALFAHAVTVLV